MPKENIYISGQVEGDGRDPDISIAWWQDEQPTVTINGHKVDSSVLDRLIRVLRRARKTLPKN